MDNKDKHESVNDRTVNDNNLNESSSERCSNSRRNFRSGDDVGLTDRLTGILVDDSDGDLLLQHSDEEDNVLQWLQALDVHVMGACRADERLKPMLKRNGASGVADDSLLAHLSQHFEPSEVAMLARCLCIPLVSIRVGKIDKQGTCLCPISTRGNLTLTLLPTSNLRISFIGDDGEIVRLATLSSNSSCSSVVIEAIPADTSGRSFVMRLTSSENFYFWCSEKSKLLGDELMDKLNNFLTKKPSLAELTGISESRLGCFVTRLRSYLGGSTVAQSQTSSVVSPSLPLDVLDIQSVTSSTKPSSARHHGNQGAIPNALHMGSLTPSASSSKDGLPINLSSLNYAREELKRHGQSHFSLANDLSAVSKTDSEQAGKNQTGNFTVYKENHSSLTSSMLDILGRSTELPSLCTSASEVLFSLTSPYYCWCPSTTSTLQYAVTPLQLPISSTESFSLPPLSSFLTSSMPSSLLAHESPLELSEMPSLDFPPFLPDPLVRLPLSMTSSQQIATFTPLMCDPIVHIPVIDICLSGPGCLVSAGPAISASIPSLRPNFINPLIPVSDSLIESSARETLRLLISSSSHTSSQLMSVFPSVLTSNAKSRNILATGSRALYEGGSNVGAIANSIAAMSFVSMSQRSVGSSSNNVFGRCLGQGDMVDQLEKQDGAGSGGTLLDDEGRG